MRTKIIPACLQCQAERPEVSSELVCGEIWQHRHGDCVFFSLSSCPTAPSQRWPTLADAWKDHRAAYAEDDAWAKAWDSHFGLFGFRCRATSDNS